MRKRVIGLPSGFVGSQHNYNFSRGKEAVRTITQNYCILNGQLTVIHYNDNQIHIQDNPQVLLGLNTITNPHK